MEKYDYKKFLVFVPLLAYVIFCMFFNPVKVIMPVFLGIVLACVIVIDYRDFQKTQKEKQKEEEERQERIRQAAERKQWLNRPFVMSDELRQEAKNFKAAIIKELDAHNLEFFGFLCPDERSICGTIFEEIFGAIKISMKNDKQKRIFKTYVTWKDGKLVWQTPTVLTNPQYFLNIEISQQRESERREAERKRKEKERKNTADDEADSPIIIVSQSEYEARQEEREYQHRRWLEMEEDWDRRMEETEKYREQQREEEAHRFEEAERQRQEDAFYEQLEAEHEQKESV